MFYAKMKKSSDISKLILVNISDVDDSGDILIPMLRYFADGYDPLLHLISLYVYCFITLYKLDVTSWSVWTTLSSRSSVLRFYSCLLQGVYIAGQSDSDCLHLHKGWFDEIETELSIKKAIAQKV